MAASEAAPRVALLARAGEACERIAVALREAGAELVLVADPMQADPAQVRLAQPQAVLVALEPAIEDAIERFEDVLADPGYMVIFEEAEQAAQRSGWDAARWLRHLSAKLHRHDDVLPAGAERADELQLTAEPMTAGPARLDFDDAIVALTGEAQGRADEVPQDGLDELLAPAPGDAADHDGLGWKPGIASGDVGSLPAPDAWSLEALPAGMADGAPAGVAEIEGIDGIASLGSDDVGHGVDAAIELSADGTEGEPGATVPTPAGGDGPVQPESGAVGEDFDFSGLSLSLDEAGEAGEGDELTFDPERFNRAGQAGEAAGGIDEFLARAVDAPGAAEDAVAGSFPDAPSADVAPAADPEPVSTPATVDFSSLSLVDDDDHAAAPAAPAKSTPAFDLDSLGAGLSLVDPDSYGHGKPPGLVLIEAGLGGPDAVRQLLAALPAGFAKPILIRLPLEGGRYDRLVKQMTRATSAPVAVAEPGVQLAAGGIHFVPPGIGIRAAGGGWVFDAGQPLDPSQLPAADSAVLFLSGADAALVPAVAGGAWAGLVLGQTPDEGCYDPVAARAAIEAGAAHGSPAELAGRLLARWPAAGDSIDTDLDLTP